MTTNITSPFEKGDPQLKYLLALSPSELKADLLSSDQSRQQAAAETIFNSLPPFYHEIFHEEGILATEMRRSLNRNQRLRTNKLNVQHAVSKQYTTKTRLVVGSTTRKFNIGNGHMLTAVEIQKLLLGALSTGKINSIHDPAITVTHKVHGRCLLLRVDIFKNHKILTVSSRRGPAIGLFCRSVSGAEATAKEIWVESSTTSLGRYRLEPVDDRFSDEQPASWTSLDPAEFQTIHKLVPLLFQIVEQEGVETLTFIGEGAGDNMTTLFDQETRRRIDDRRSQPETPAIFFFTARTPSGQVYDYHRLIDWKLPVVNIIPSPTSERTKWSLKEVMDMWEQQQGTVTVCNKEFAIPPIVEFAGKQLCGVHDSFEKHPIEGVAISFGPWVLKAKNPFYADKEELAEEEAAKRKGQSKSSAV